MFFRNHSSHRMPLYPANRSGPRVRIDTKAIRMASNLQAEEFMAESANLEHEQTSAATFLLVLQVLRNTRPLRSSENESATSLGYLSLLRSLWTNSGHNLAQRWMRDEFRNRPLHVFGQTPVSTKHGSSMGWRLTMRDTILMVRKSRRSCRDSAKDPAAGTGEISEDGWRKLGLGSWNSKFPFPVEKYRDLDGNGNRFAERVCGTTESSLACRID